MGAGGGGGSDKRLHEVLSWPLMVFSAAIWRSRQRGFRRDSRPECSSSVALTGVES